MIKKFLEPIDNILISLNENKDILLIILGIFGIYFINYNYNIVINNIELFDNNYFKFFMFIIISYIASSNPAIGISLAIIILVSMQIITQYKINKEFEDIIFSE